MLLSSLYSIIAVRGYSESIANASRDAWDMGIGSIRYSSSEKKMLLNSIKLVVLSVKLARIICMRNPQRISSD